MTDYEYDIFVSYYRSSGWTRWTLNNLVEPLSAVLSVQMGPLRVFVDSQIPSGATWPQHLARALARSKTMIAVLSAAYFESDWCRLEIALMLERERRLGLRTADNDRGLIFPLVLGGTNRFAAEIKAIQSEDIWEYANPCLRVDSRKQQQFVERMKRWCPDIGNMISTAPSCDPLWGEVAHDEFCERFRINSQNQITVPRLAFPAHKGKDKVR